MTNIVVRTLFKLVWWHWVSDCKIVKVKGWRRALVDVRGYRRQTVSCCFWWFK